MPSKTSVWGCKCSCILSSSMLDRISLVQIQAYTLTYGGCYSVPQQIIHFNLICIWRIEIYEKIDNSLKWWLSKISITNRSNWLRPATHTHTGTHSTITKEQETPIHISYIEMYKNKWTLLDLGNSGNKTAPLFGTIWLTFSMCPCVSTLCCLLCNCHPHLGHQLLLNPKCSLPLHVTVSRFSSTLHWSLNVT